MKREETLLSAMGGMEDRFLMEAQNYGKKRRTHLRKGIIAIAAVVALMATSVTALAANATWRETIRGWFGIGENGASGYAEYEDQAVTLGDLEIQQLSEFCSGNQMVAFFEVQPAEGAAIDSGIVFEPQILDEQRWVNQINLVDLSVVSDGPDDILLKLTVEFVDSSAMEELPFRLYTHPKGEYGTDWTDDHIVYSEEMTLKLVDTPMLSANANIPLENTAADSTGELMAVQICSGSLEIIVGHEFFENWCNRVCVPDSGKRFMEAYMGATWTPGTPESDGEATPYFTQEDELAIAEAFRETWNDTIASILGTVKITLKDGTTLSVQDEPTVSYNSVYSENGVDAYTYRYTILPLISLEDIASVEVDGQVLEMHMLSQAS